MTRVNVGSMPPVGVPPGSSDVLGGIDPTPGVRDPQLLAQEFRNPVLDWLGEKADAATTATLAALVVTLYELGGAMARGSAQAAKQFGVAWDQMTSALSRFGGRVGQLAGALQALSPEQRQVFVQSLARRVPQVGSVQQLEAAVRGALGDARREGSSGRSGGSVKQVPVHTQTQTQTQVRPNSKPWEKPTPQRSPANPGAVNPRPDVPRTAASQVRSNPGAASLTGFTRDVVVQELQAMVRTPAVISTLAGLGVRSGAVPPALQPRQLGTLAGLEKHLGQLERLRAMLGNDWGKVPGGAALDNEITQVRTQIERVHQALATQRSSKPKPTASVEASMGRVVQAAQASSQALQREEALPQSASPAQRQAAHAEVVRQGEALRAALARPEIVALLAGGLAASAGGAPQPPEDGRLYEVLMNGLVAALGQSATDALRPLTGGAPVTPAEQLRGALQTALIGAVLPDGTTGLRGAALTNAIGAGLESVLRGDDPGATLLNITIGGSSGVALHARVRHQAPIPSRFPIVRSMKSTTWRCAERFR
jgi:hypothetical protein